VSEFVYTLSKLEKTIQGKPLFKNISLSFLPGAKIGVIGSNGSGKSTLLKIMAGLDDDISGEAFPASGIKMGYLPQDPTFDGKQTVFEALKGGAQETFDLLKKYEDLNMKLCEIDDDAQMEKVSNQISVLQDQLDASNAWDLEQNIKRLCENLKCPPSDQLMETLSGGEKRRIALARLILSEPDFYLLDEPTNHLDAVSIHWLQSFLKSTPATVVVITHDRYFLDEITKWILELDRGKGIPWEASYHEWLEKKLEQMRLTDAGDSHKKFILEAELNWFRLSDEEKQDQIKWRVKSYDHFLGRKANEIVLPPIPRLGQKVCEIKNLSKSFPQKPLFSKFSMSVPPGAVVGVVGPNGAGKTTFFNILCGLEKPDEGSVEFGETVQLGFSDQARAGLDLSKSVFENLAEGADTIEIKGQLIKVRSFLSQFGFKGSDQQKRVSDLSGGEKNRLYLAQTLLGGANVLVLDEPTNDLDIETLRSLETALQSFQGTLFIASHDRWFLDRISTHSIVFSGQGNVQWFDGSISEYLRQKA
jgi:ATP-binding cassette ChvD family protein